MNNLLKTALLTASLSGIWCGVTYGSTQTYGSTRNIKTFSLSYMTAKEMQAKVRNITGFLHTDFDTYADVLGRWDPNSGTRTADRPSLVSFLFVKKISANVAEAVLQREVFLDASERTVFRNADLDRSPTDEELDDVIANLYQSWLLIPIDSEILNDLSSGFRSREAEAGHLVGFKWLVELLLQHGGLYYY